MMEKKNQTNLIKFQDSLYIFLNVTVQKQAYLNKFTAISSS